jgi:hypothetical protein
MCIAFLKVAQSISLLQADIDSRSWTGEMCKNGSWVLHQDNAPAHNTLSVKTILTEHKITMLVHPQYAREQAQCDSFFYLLRSGLR